MAKTLGDFDEMRLRTELEYARKDINERVEIAVHELTHPTLGKIALDNVAVQLVGIAKAQGIVEELNNVLGSK